MRGGRGSGGSDLSPAESFGQDGLCADGIAVDGGVDTDSRRLSLAIVVSAAGRGVRFDSGVPKQYTSLSGVPMVERTLEALSECDRVDALALVVNPDRVDESRDMCVGLFGGKVVAVVAGGEERPFSVRNGVEALAEYGSWDLIGVHDGVRPLVTCDEVNRAVAVLRGDPDLDGIVLGIPSKDTVKTVDEAGMVTGTPGRRELWQAQTPQIFRWETLLSAYRQADDVLRASTDDSSLVEASGGRVMMVRGSSENLKITEPSDLRYAELILEERERS